MHNLKHFGLGLLALVLILVPLAGAQSEEIILTLALPEYVGDMLDMEVFHQFEADHPGVKVHVTTSNMMYLPPVAFDVEEHLDSVEQLTASADVLLIDTRTLSVAATRAGYFLDLAPLANSDPGLNADDFYPAAWQSFQWDNGIWGLPVGQNLISLSYRPDAFDEAGLSYPDPSWTIEDLAHAARILTQYAPDGTTTQPGLLTFGLEMWLFRSLLGKGFYDDTTLPETPNLTDPALLEILTIWHDLQEEGVMATPEGGMMGGPDNPIPMRVEWTNQLGMFSGPGAEEELVAMGTYLPGGAVGLLTQGLVISGGTQHPDLAYALTRYLTYNPTFAYASFSGTPARQSLADIGPEDDMPVYTPAYHPEIQSFVEEAIWEALPSSALRYGWYITTAFQEMDQPEGETDLNAVLEAAELQAIADIETAIERSAQTTVEVATPIPTPILAPGEVSINFGLMGLPMPPGLIDEQIQQIVDEFIAGDPEVRQVVLDTQVNTPPEEWDEELDCFYTIYFPPDYRQIMDLLNLDPFLDADPDFDRGDVFAGVLTQLQQENLIWGLPITLQPNILSYNPKLLAQAGVPLPDPLTGWTVDAFTDALHQLKDYLPDTTPFEPRSSGQGHHLLMLVAAHGGLPLDYRTTPVTVNFTAPETVEAIRQVLDLAREGYMAYTALTNMRGGGGGSVSYSTLDEIPISTMDGLMMLNPALGPVIDEEVALPQPVTYPSGSRYTPVMYTIGTGYISANTPNPEACYRWLSHLAKYPHLLSGMPVRRSQLDDPALEAARSPEEVAFYHQFDTVLQSPEVVVFDTYGMDFGNFIIQYWLLDVFDAYVLEDAELKAALAEAETKALNFQACTMDLPPLDLSLDQEAIEAQFEQYTDCALSADPDLAEWLSP